MTRSGVSFKIGRGGPRWRPVRGAPSVAAGIPDRIEAFGAGARAFIWAHQSEWSLDHNVDLEVTNHVLRVLIQEGSIGQHVGYMTALCRVQHEDGGWGDTRDDPHSQLRSTSFCVQMLLRALRQVPEPQVEAAARRGIGHIIDVQRKDGSWTDRRWHQLDACSTSVGTLLFAANDVAFRSDAVTAALDAGIAFIDRMRGKDGLWRYKQRASPVTITAHLMQKTALYHGFTDIEAGAVARLLDLQHPDGHWDQQNVDHTCDAARSLMLVASRCRTQQLMRRVEDASRRAVMWLLDVTSDGGLGDRPGRRAHVERTCDGLDTMLKFQTFTADASRIHQFWH